MVYMWSVVIPLAECAANAGSCKKVAAVGINCTPPRSTDDTIRNSDLDETPSEIGGYQHRSMGQQNDGPALGPLRVVDLDQCTSEAKVILKMEKSAAGEYLVWSEEQRKFKILPCDTRLHRKLVQLDENGRQVAMLKAKNITTHDRWLGYSCRGESKADRKKEFSMYRDHTDLHVTLETSSSNAVDFKVSVNRTAKTCTIYKGDSSTVMAQTHQVGNEDSILVEVYPNVDCAFVALLIVIVDAMNSPGKLRVVAGRAAKLTGKFVGGAILVAGQFVANAIIC